MSRRRLAKIASSSNSLSNMNKTLRMAQRRQRQGVPVVEGAESKIHLRLRREGQVTPSTSRSQRSKKMLRRLVHGASRKFVGMKIRKSIAASTTDGVFAATKDNSEMGGRASKDERSAYSNGPASRRRSSGSVSTLSTSSDLTPDSATQDSPGVDSPKIDKDSPLPCQSPTPGNKADGSAGDLGAPPRRNSMSTNGYSFKRGKGKGPPPPPPRRSAPNKSTYKPLKSEGSANQTSRCSGLPRRHSSGSIEQCRIRAAETKGKRRLNSNRKKPSLEQRGLSSAFATVTKEAKARSIDAKGRKSAREKDPITHPVRVPHLRSEPYLPANKDVFIYKVRRSNSPQECGKGHQSPQEITGSRGKPSNALNGGQQKGSKSSQKVAESDQRHTLPDLRASIVENSERQLKQALDECIELLEDRLELLEQREEECHSFNDHTVESYTAKECKDRSSGFNLSIIEEESHTAKSMGSSKTDETAPSSDNSSYEFSGDERRQKSFISCDSTVKVANCMVSN